MRIQQPFHASVPVLRLIRRGHITKWKKIDKKYQNYLSKYGYTKLNFSSAYLSYSQLNNSCDLVKKKWTFKKSTSGKTGTRKLMKTKLPNQ